MKESKRPPASKRPISKRSISLRSPAPSDVGTRIGDFEAELRAARADIVALRAEIDRVRAELEAVQRDLVLVATRLRKVPPPLHNAGAEEIISVDDSEVVLESIRPPALRRPRTT